MMSRSIFKEDVKVFGFDLKYSWTKAYRIIGDKWLCVN